MAKKAAKKTPKRKTAKAKAKPAPAKATAKRAPAKGPGSQTIGDVRELIDLMVSHDITEVNYEDGDKKILLRRGQAGAPVMSVGTPVAAPGPGPMTTSPALAAEMAGEGDALAPPDNLIEIVSPMVGTFYAAPSPDSDSFVVPDSRVSDDTVICIVEAMKVMNEIKAECAGTVVEMCVKNAQPVEYGQVLFRVKPA